MNGTIRTEPVMGTLITIHVVRSGAGAAIERAFGWFREIECRCTRFHEKSELMQLSRNIGVPVQTSAILFEAVRFALSVAEESGGAFDPTNAAGATYRDVETDAELRTITLHRPLTLDLGAVAKGLAVDMAARELAPLVDFAIDAGGDLYLGGSNPQGAPWSVGIRNPFGGAEPINTLRVSNQAVCTSGCYERGAHILDARTGTPAVTVASATVVAQGAMLADALATAAFILGPADGIDLLNRMEVDGLIVTPELQRYATRGLRHAA
jgi:thiamine biosynthesis lipoprotein